MRARIFHSFGRWRCTVQLLNFPAKLVGGYIFRAGLIGRFREVSVTDEDFTRSTCFRGAGK
jgi:hypothetical protein